MANKSTDSQYNDLFKLEDKIITDKVWERIGRLKEKYVSVHKYHDITVLFATV